MRALSRLPPPGAAAPVTDRSPDIRAAFVSTYPPRHCGVATYTHALASAMGGGEIVVLNPPDHVTPYPPEVHHRIRRDETADYPRVAKGLARCSIDVVSIQHEFGIWGGEDGSSVLDFVDALDVPAVVTLHAIPRHPTTRQSDIVRDLVRHAAATVVMSRSAAARLGQVYAIDLGRLAVIPHGVPNLPLVDPETMKPGLGLAGRQVMLSFGLLGPGKGYERVIEAMPAVVAAVPTVRYVIVGATHPDTLRSGGEGYRQTLLDRVSELGLADHVQFVDRFVGHVELGKWLEAADLFVAAQTDPEQTMSGAMACAVGAGRAIVATPSAYADELLADERGVVLPSAAARALAAACIDLLGDPERRARLGRLAYDHGRDMIWSDVGATYRALFARVAARPVEHALRPVALTSLQPQ